MNTIREPSRDVPIVHECDVCVIGGSTTGAFAAIAAARLGARVALVEVLGMLGGTATASLVCVWHSHRDTSFTRQIIGGLPIEAMERLKRRGGAEQREGSENLGFSFLPYELAIELDEMVADTRIRLFLHARFAAPAMEGAGTVAAAVIEDKSGRRAIRARVFIDASGDGDLAQRAGFETYRARVLQPPTTCAVYEGLDPARIDLQKNVFDPRYPEALRPGYLWGLTLPGSSLYMVAGTRVHGADCSDADELTRAEIEGRRQVRATLDLLRRHVPGGGQVRLQALPARIGIRQTRQVRCLHCLTEREVLSGQRFADAIANGSYRVDVHAGDGDGLVFRYLDGREDTVYADGRRTSARWRDAGPDAATFYQVPYRCLVPTGSRNLLVAGRCIDADEGAFGAIRVMVNCAQLGEAAGTAAALALGAGCGVAEVDAGKLRATLAKHGAIII